MNARIFNLTRNINLLNNFKYLNNLEQRNKNFHITSIYLAGHSKWANIKHIKALKDGQRAVQFVKLSRQIRIAIQEGGSTNPTLNTPLKNAIDLALSKNMPMATIQNSLKKFETNKALLKKYTIDVRFMSKIFVILSVYTDNFTMLKQSVATTVKKFGASYVDARHLFDESGLIETKYQLDLSNLEETATEHAIEFGAEEVEVVDKSTGLVNFLCDPIDLQRISNDLFKKGYTIENSEHIFFPKTPITASEEELKIFHQFVDKLKAIDGVEEIYDNLESSC